MKALMLTSAAIGSVAFIGAFTSSGYTERNAAAGRGAAIGAAVGGAAGAAKGCSEASDCDMPGVKDQPDERDSDGDGIADINDRYPYDRSRW